MKRTLLILLCSAFVLGCAKENITDPEESVKTTLSVSIPETKTSISAPDADGIRTVKWLAGDKLNVNGVTSDALSSDYSGKASAQFTFDGLLSLPYKIIYPASFYKEDGKIVLPSCQSKMPGTDDLATDTFPMYAYCTSESGITLHHLCSIVKFQVKLVADNGTVPTIAAVTFTGNNGEQVCGEFNLDFTTGTLTGASDKESFRSVSGISSKSGDDGSIINCNIVVPAGVYSNGFTIRIVDANGNYEDKAVSSSKTFAAGASYKFPEFTYTPDGKLADAVIFTAQDLVDFANKWNSYEFAGESADVFMANNITFDETTSAAFVAAGGIGSATLPDGTGTNHYNGVFDGNGHSIAGLTSTIPVFPYTGGGAEIKNLTIDETCTFTCPAGGAADWGVIVGRQKGSVTDCTCEADVTIEANTTSSTRNIGAITGRTYGASVQGCTMTGDINFTTGTFTDNQLNIGGVTGCEDGTSSIIECSFEGKMNISDGTTYGGPGYTSSKTNLYVGGVVGYVKTSSTISNCSTSNSASLVMAGKYCIHAGGIVGGSVGGTVKNCNNAASIKYSSNEARANTSPTYIGGIIGHGTATNPSDLSIYHCTNTGSVASYCNTTTLGIGGIAGCLSGTVDNCSNSGTVSRYNADATVAQRNRYCSIGGVVGDLNSGSTVSNSSNSGKMYSQDHTTSTNATYDVGGIVGTTRGSNSITNCECTASEIRSRGDKSTSPNPSLTRDDIGGIAGILVGTTVSGCNANGVSIVNLYSVNCLEGGICGTMDASSSVSSSNVINIKITKNDVDGNMLGAITGTSVSGSTINGCGISGKWTADSGTTWHDFTLDDISSDTNFTGSGNTLYTKTYDLTGKVSCGGTGVANVVVSDGYSSTITDADGMYYLQSSDSTTCVSVSIPSGYMVSSKSGIPAFWKKLSTVTASNGIKTVNFTLNTVSNPDNWTIYMYADIQIRSLLSNGWDASAFHSQAVAADVFSDIKDRADATGGNIVGISLGDQLHETQSLYSTYLSSSELGKLNFPNFSLMGNHDYNTESSDYVSAAANFESNLSPVRYSFNIGGFHVIILDNARTLKGVGETKGLPGVTLQWLKSDLKYVPSSTPIILCSHRPLFMEMYTGEETPRLRDISTRSWIIGSEYADLLSGYKKVYAFNGDVHNIFNYKYTSGEKKNIECHALPRATGELWTNQFLNQCGTPRGYLEIKISGDDLTYKFKPVAYQTGSCADGPSPMTYRDFTTSDGKFYMKSSYLSAKGKLLDDFYQIHAYAPGTGYGAATTYPNDVIAVVFMYDDRWGDVTFSYTGGSMKMTRIGLDENLRDPGYTWLHDYYKANNKDLKGDSAYVNEYPLNNAFRCTPPSGVTTGTISVTDQFGNKYENKISW